MSIQMNPSGKWTFRELELKVIDYHRKAGYVDPSNTKTPNPSNKEQIGRMIMDVFIITEALGLDFTECLGAAYEQATGDKK